MVLLQPHRHIHVRVQLLPGAIQGLIQVLQLPQEWLPQLREQHQDIIASRVHHLLITDVIAVLLLITEVQAVVPPEHIACHLHQHQNPEVHTKEVVHLPEAAEVIAAAGHRPEAAEVTVEEAPGHQGLQGLHPPLQEEEDNQCNCC